MDTFLENAQRILEVAKAGGEGEQADFALVIRPDGGLHFIMETPVSLEGAAAYAGAASAYHVKRSARGVSVEGMASGRSCRVEERSDWKRMLQDQADYRMNSPLLNSAATSGTPGSEPAAA